VSTSRASRVEARIERLNQWSFNTKLMAIWSLLVAAFQLVTLPGAVLSMAVKVTDFQAFYRAGQWMLGPQTTPLYPLTSFAGYRGPPADLTLYLNPPHFLVAFSPLLSVPLRTAYLLFSLLNVVCFFATLWVLRPFLRGWRNGQRFCAVAVLIGSPFLTAAVAQGTVSMPVTLCLAVVVSHDVQQRTNTWRGSLLSGFCLSLLSMKPQYLILIGLYLFARSQWKVLFVGVCSTAAWFSASVAAMGIEPWLRYPRYLQIFTQQLDTYDTNDRTSYWVAEQMINVRGVFVRVLSFSQAGLINTLSTAVLLLAGAITVTVGVRVGLGQLDAVVAWCLVLLAVLATSGHANPPDGVTIMIPAILGWSVLRSVRLRNAFAWSVPVLTVIAYTTLGVQHRGSPPILGFVLVAITVASLFGNRSGKALMVSRPSPMT
jgi:Glycosyltransferase family 87